MNVPRTLRRATTIARRGAENVRMLTRLTRDVPDFLREPITLEDAQRWQRERLATREQRLLMMAEEQIYGHARCP